MYTYIFVYIYIYMNIIYIYIYTYISLYVYHWLIALHNPTVYPLWIHRQLQAPLSWSPCLRRWLGSTAGNGGISPSVVDDCGRFSVFL